MDTRLYSTDKGQVIRKIPDNEFIIEFGNISWRLTAFQFRLLRDFVLRIDGDYYERINRDSFYRRKIRIPVKGTNLSILLYQEELGDLKELLSGVPDDFMEDDSLFDSLYKLSEDAYDRYEEISSARLVQLPVRLHLN